MIYQFDVNAISSALYELDEAKRIAYGIFLFERAIPYYLRFQVDTGSSGGGELRAALAQCWSALEKKSLHGVRFTTVDACEKLMPDSESSTSSNTSAAIDAVNIACSLISYLELGELRFLMDATESRRDTVDLIVQRELDLAGSDADFEGKITAHPLMQEELRLLYEDIALLKSLPSSGSTVLATTIERVEKRARG